MPLERIYLTRHGHRLNWTIDLKTGTYHAQFPTPTGNPADPTLTSHGVQQSRELAAHLVSPQFEPKPCRVYCSPFYRCLQTIQPGVQALKEYYKNQGGENDVDLDVRIENGLGEWFGASTFFDHPSPASPLALRSHFPTIMHPNPDEHYTATVIPSGKGETITQLHDRVATTLAAIISDLDNEINTLEANQPPEARSSKAILICSHAAPLIAMGRALTGNMPEDPNEEDFNVFTSCLSTFVRRQQSPSDISQQNERLAPGTKITRPEVKVPDWRGGRGVGGGWDCVSNGDCSFLSNGAERGWHFNGDESFDTGPMAPPTEPPTLSNQYAAPPPSTKL
ncbi:phosphoglycerate mutase family protein [Paecilomyces variotii]|uniref:Phosphoglycerate mutase family protein n=1 Tax=Byssochlamys spectabilis TaxID=264951 RepID=A0A443HY87_BYSSP|nr:phosphoglycerate mutase family protein [Paecilomyces variotii]RWQ96799.1 phosphoglycerate mutase family protein [Paecilomyces variotii]